MFAGDGAAPRQHLTEQFIERGGRTPFCARLGEVNHHVRVDIAVARMTKAGKLQLVFLLQTRGQREQVFQPAARYDDVLIQLGQAGVPQ